MRRLSTNILPVSMFFHRSSLVVRSCAKINVSIKVISSLSNGFHDLEMVNLPLDLHDVISISKAPYSVDTFVTCDDASLDFPRHNLCTKAIEKMREAFGFKENAIILAAGKGSRMKSKRDDVSKVSYPILGVPLLGIKTTPEMLSEIGLQIGADVPFFLSMKPSIVRGIGERLEPFELSKSFYCLLVKPVTGLSTKKVFETYDELKCQPLTTDTAKVVEALKQGDDAALGKAIGNDLMAASINLLPEIDEIIESLRFDGFKAVSMSGSGSTVFALTNDQRLAKESYRKYDELGYVTRLTKTAIILAAGKGSRMKSKRDDVSKVSYPILGVPLLGYVMDALETCSLSKLITVLGFGGETSRKIAEGRADIVWQKEQKGSGHAVMMAAPLLEGMDGETIVCCGDTPLLKGKTLQNLFEFHENNHNDLTVLTFHADNPKGYGRIVRENGLVKDGYVAPDPVEMSGINDRVQLAAAAKALQKRINEVLMLSGVTIEDPETAYIGPYVKIGADAVIKPNTTILGATEIGEENVIGPNSYLENVKMGSRGFITFSHVVDCELGEEVQVGPFARLRGNSKVHDKGHIGNFMELKNVDFGEGTKAMHLSYLGDAKIGSGCNIGCGTIIANYDGVNKFHSDIGDRVFVGSGSTLISPVVLGNGSFVAAGSTITDNVEQDAMAIARSRQTNKPGYSTILHKRAELKKKNTKK